MAGENTLEFTEDNFEAEVLKSETPVLVDFWAEWCQPCLMLAPTIDELANDFAGRVKVGKVNVDSAEALAGQYGVQNIPTVVLFDGGDAVEKVVGARQKQDYATLLESRISER